MKKILSFGFGVFGRWRHDWGMFCGFLWRHQRSNEPISWLKLLLGSRLLYESLLRLIDFLAFLVPKLWPKTPNISGIPQRRGLKGISLIDLRYLAIILKPEALESQWNPLKTYYSLESNKTLSHEIDSFGRLPGDDDVIQM